jgi:hypothetical protein
MEATMKDWLGSFWKIVIYPSEATFFNEAQKADGKTSSAVGLLLLLTLFIHLYNYVFFQTAFPVVVIILSFLLIPLDIFLLAFCLDTIYRNAFHRKKSYYEEFLYIGVVTFISSQLLFFLLNMIPPIRGNQLLWVSYLYLTVLLIIAVKSLTKLKAWQATVTVILSVILSVAGLIFMPVCLFSVIRAVPGVL